MMFRPMPVLSGLTLVSLIILMMLGNWQYARYAEKKARPSVAEQTEERVLIQADIDRSNPGYAQQVYGFANSEPIWRRYAPATLSDTGESVLVMVEATGGAKPVPIEISALPITVSFEGLVSDKEVSTSAFVGRDEPDQNIWYRFDPSALAARLGLSGTPRVAEPITISIRNAGDLTQVRTTLNPYAFAKPVDPLPPERHFGYALTWWGMALGLLGVYVALHHSRGRLRFKKA